MCKVGHLRHPRTGILALTRLLVAIHLHRHRRHHRISNGVLFDILPPDLGGHAIMLSS